MRRLGRVTWISLALMLVLLFSGLATQAQGDPISLDGIENYVVVLSDGRLDVRYTITFTELEAAGRERFRELGQFPQPHTVTDAYGMGPDGRFPVSLSGGPTAYAVNFGIKTERNSQYKVHIRYTVDRSVFDETSIGGQPYRAIGWAPFQWSLPIAYQEIRYILPVELPADVTAAEQVTDALVNEAGLVVNNADSFDRWVYFSTPDEASGKNYLSILVAETNQPAMAQMIPAFFLPGGSITVTRETPIPLDRPTPAVAEEPLTVGEAVESLFNELT